MATPASKCVHAVLLGTVVLAAALPAAAGRDGVSAPGPAEAARFGWSVAVSGDTAVVGAHHDETPGNGRSGAAYVFVRSGTTWTEQQELVASDAALDDEFGVSVSIDGDTIVVGARLHDTAAGADAGAAYVFVRSGTTWTEQRKLVAGAGAAGDQFGGWVSISGDTIAVGAQYAALPSQAWAGAVYVFVRSGTTWTQQQELRASDHAAGDDFGGSVSISGDTLAVSAPGADTSPGNNEGAAYVFVRSGTTWTEQQKLLASGRATSDFLGPVAVSGDTLVAGNAVCQPRGGNVDGSAYVFVRSGTLWAERQRLREPIPDFCGFFGSSVAVSGDTVVVGARGLSSHAAYVFVRAPGNLWPLQQKLEGPLPFGEPYHVGRSAAVSADTAIIGAPTGSTYPYDTFGGAAFVFTRSGTTWTSQQGLGSGIADLSASLTDSPDPVVGLAILDYQVAINNAGPDEATSVTVRLGLSPLVTFQSAAGTGWTCTPPPTCNGGGCLVICTRPTLPVGPAPVIAVAVRAPPLAGLVSVGADVTVSQADPGWNHASEQTTVTDAPMADLSVTKSDGGVVARWGQPLTWTIAAANDGPEAVMGALVSDTFPPGVTGVVWTCAASSGASCPASGSGDISASLTLPLGGTATFTATGTVSPGTLSLVNTATIATPATVLDQFPPNNTSATISSVEPSTLHTLTPCRIVDTRTAPPPLAANTTRTFAVAGACGVPVDARAVVVILTAVNPGDFGDLRLYPTGQAMPGASALNFSAGRTRANNATVPLGTDGQLDVRCDMPPGSSATTHFLLDVFGYFR